MLTLNFSYSYLSLILTMKNFISMLLLLPLILSPLACLGQAVTDGGAFFHGKVSGKEATVDSQTVEREKSQIQLVTPQFDIGKKKKDASGSELEDRCPKSERLAKKLANSDVAEFFKKTPLGTWDLFMHKFRKKYSNCPSYVKRAYLNAARDKLTPQTKSMFQR